MRRVLLTDQALVAVAAARQAGAQRSRPPTAADLLEGLAAESEGTAGALLRRPGNAAARLPGRVATAPAALPSLEAVVARAAASSRRPVASTDLLAALLEVAGADVVDLLAACGYDPRQLYRDATDEGAGTAETFGLGSEPDLSADAATAVARVRAAAGGAVDLVVALAATPRGEALVAADADELAALRADLRRRGEEAAAGDEWDRGLDAVLGAARAWRPAPLDADDLLRAVQTAGGVGPARLLDEAARLADGDRT